jgi:DNA-binding Lrp family transcriptional regulator
MREAFVCINSSPDSIDSILTELKACKEVKEVLKVYGVYDIIARVSGESLEDLSNFIETRIKCLNEVQTTLSMLMIKPGEFTRKNEILTV